MHLWAVGSAAQLSNHGARGAYSLALGAGSVTVEVTAIAVAKVVRLGPLPPPRSTATAQLCLRPRRPCPRSLPGLNLALSPHRIQTLSPPQPQLPPHPHASCTAC